MKRLHPVNFADSSYSDLIDVNDMVSAIKASTDTTKLNDGHSTKAKKYHKGCVANTDSGAPKQYMAKTASLSAKSKTETAKKTGKKTLPFQTSYLKTSKTKNRSPVTVVTKQKFPRRYDNFLKSGNRSGSDQVKTKKAAPTETITKRQYLEKVGRTSDDEGEIPISGNYEHTSTPLETERNFRTSYISEDDAEGESNKEDETYDFTESNNEVIQTKSNEVDNPKRVNVLQTISIPPASTTSSQSGLSFEEKVLNLLGEMKKSQQTFETRMEERIETFINDQKKQPNDQPRLQNTSQSRMQGNYRQSRQYTSARIQNQKRCREPVLPVDVDFEEFEELDEKFPVDVKNDVEELEFCIRRDLEFKFLMHARLNELSGRNYKKCIRLKMKYLFADEALELYTWRGTQEKDSFKKFKAINVLILRSVRDDFPDCKYDAFKGYMMQWLKHAKSRQRIITYTYPEPGSKRKKLNEDEDDSSYDEE